MTKKKVANDLLKISIYQFNRDGLLKPGTRETVIGWPGTEGQVKVSVDIRDDGYGLVRLIYSINGTNYNTPVRIESTQCKYGGVRYWFRCGRCYSEVEEPVRRFAVLRFDGAYFCCPRCCGGLTYRSQLDRFHDVSVHTLDTPEPTHLVYGGKLTRRGKRFEKKQKKARALVGGVLRKVERQEERFQKEMQKYEEKYKKLVKRGKAM